MDAKKQTDQDLPNEEGSLIFRVLTLGVFLFVVYVYATADRSSIQSAFHCISILFLAICWLFTYNQVLLFLKKQRMDSLEQRIAALEKQLEQQNKE